MVKLNKVRKILLNDLYEKRWDCRERKADLDFDDDLGELITCSTREKIFNLIINIFKSIIEGDKEYILKNMPRLLKMIKLHIYQLVKLKTETLNVNIRYFREAIRTIYAELNNI